MSSKCGLVHIFICHSNLMIARSEIQFGEDMGAFKFVKQLINNWNWKFILDCYLIKRSVVYTQPP